MDPLKSITNIYCKCSNFGKILIFIALLLITIVFFKSIEIPKFGVEGFQSQEKFLFKSGDEVYDDFYANIYDYLVFNNIKNAYEIGEIINKTSADETSVILDVGCGTGHHVALLEAQGIKATGVDSSTAMVKKAKENYPQFNFVEGNVMDSSLFMQDSYTHILCLYFSIYYFKDKMSFFNNTMKWLMPGGFLVVHVVERDMFDPILPPANPLFLVSPQRYAKERITQSKVVFDKYYHHKDQYH